MLDFVLNLIVLSGSVIEYAAFMAVMAFIIFIVVDECAALFVGIRNNNFKGN